VSEPAKFGDSGRQIDDASERGSKLAIGVAATGSGVALCPGGSCLGGFGAPGGISERRLELSGRPESRPVLSSLVRSARRAR
jgi:hypothetical protein